jgi:hypothetical protein
MAKVLTVDAALAILTKAKKQVGGDAPLVLSLADSEMADCNVNDIVVINDGENQYVEVQAHNAELLRHLNEMQGAN